MLRAVLDANVLVSAFIQPLGPSGKILKSFIDESGFELVLSQEILEKLHRCLLYPRVRKHLVASDEELELRVASLGLLADITPGVLETHVVVADPDDDKYVAAALEGRANFIVSGDHHLLDLREVQGVQILKPRAFLRILESMPRKRRP